MGYNVHITRSDWVYANRQRNRIILDEWRRVAEADSDFVRAEHATAYRWTVSNWTFCYRQGRVFVKSPDDDTLRKIFEVARKLNALVQGDNGKYYRQTQDAYESYEEDGAVRATFRWGGGD